MNQRNYLRPWTTALCSLLGCVVAQWFGVTSADASCGDWLAHTHDMAAMHGGDDANRQHRRDQASVNNEARSSDHPVSKPCHGPFCRNAPSQPAPPAPVNINLHVEKLVLCGLADLNLTGCRQSQFGGETDAHPLRGFPNLIDHPPRG
jgi:hypothetical protein